MINRISVCISLTFLVGCVGDRLTFHQAGNATVTEDRICIISWPGDVMQYYSLSSSEISDVVPVITEDDIAKKYPDVCIPVILKKNTKYELIYELNRQKYRFEFGTDAHNKVIKTYSRL